MNKHNETKEPRLNWQRTGKTTQELSVNKKGVITLAEEKAGNRRRLEPIAYVSL